jgi:uncharacterized protein (TIGR02145 family)
MTKLAYIIALILLMAGLRTNAQASFAAMQTRTSFTRLANDSLLLTPAAAIRGTKQWQSSLDSYTWTNVTTNLSGNVLALRPPTITYFRLRITEGSCSPIYSDTIKVYPQTTTPTAYVQAGVSLVDLVTAHVPASDLYPTVTTSDVSAITQSGAVSGGNVISEGCYPVTAKGVCWSSNKTPTVSDSKTTNDMGIGTFTSVISGITSETTYHIRAYATNAAATSYGEEKTITTQVTDIDGNGYDMVTIGTQVWMKQNLKTTRLNDGTAIPLIRVNNLWSNSKPAYCWFNNDSLTYKNPYGALYNYYAVYTTKLCPVGWHVPSDAEWTILTDYLGGISVAGDKLKEISITHWNYPNTGATNSSGFTALPGGCRDYSSVFTYLGSLGFWWSSTTYNTANAFGRRLSYYNSNVSASDLYALQYGLSVRCLKN